MIIIIDILFYTRFSFPSPALYFLVGKSNHVFTGRVTSICCRDISLYLLKIDVNAYEKIKEKKHQFATKTVFENCGLTNIYLLVNRVTIVAVEDDPHCPYLVAGVQSW